MNKIHLFSNGITACGLSDYFLFNVHKFTSFDVECISRYLLCRQNILIQINQNNKSYAGKQLLKFLRFTLACC